VNKKLKRNFEEFSNDAHLEEESNIFEIRYEKEAFEIEAMDDSRSGRKKVLLSNSNSRYLDLQSSFYFISLTKEDIEHS